MTSSGIPLHIGTLSYCRLLMSSNRKFLCRISSFKSIMGCGCTSARCRFFCCVRANLLWCLISQRNLAQPRFPDLNSCFHPVWWSRYFWAVLTTGKKVISPVTDWFSSSPTSFWICRKNVGICWIPRRSFPWCGKLSVQYRTNLHLEPRNSSSNLCRGPFCCLCGSYLRFYCKFIFLSS